MASGAQIRLSLRVYHLLATLALPKNMALVLGSACFGGISTFGGEVGLHASFGFVAFIHGFFQFQTSSTTIGKALDKIRFEGLTDKSKLDAQPELLIRLVPDKANKTLLIVDSGVGMTKADYWLVSQTCDGCYCSWSKLQMKAIGDYGFGDTFM